MNYPALMIASLACLLTACAASTPSDGPAIVAETAALDKRLPLEKPAPELRRDCLPPVIAPLRKLSAGETERYWRRDKIALVDCAARKRAVQKFYDDRDARLAGQKGERGE